VAYLADLGIVTLLLRFVHNLEE